MAIVYPLVMPISPRARELRVTAVSSVGSSISPWTFSENVQSHPGQRWEIDISLPPMLRDDAQDWIAFLLALNGQEGTFLAGDSTMESPRGPMGGSPVVSGAGQTGITLNVSGCTNNQTPWAKAGDPIQLGTGLTTRFHRVLSDANSNGSGQVSIDLWPRVRIAPSNGATILTRNTLGLWRLATSQNSWTVGTAMLHGMMIVAVEAL